ncbi:HGGxSTG domain-containing protein [Marinobacter psychrophilus]|jgi:hypothetical protein|uniref:HGGxSTG domain-containing protein n=1 Tax=Marinobacter psychrophilus TaxID=330734 RepID=UPI00235306F7|nr:HGGxSTG domain-containing protein [Marinobacter psychrophilus]
MNTSCHDSGEPRYRENPKHRGCYLRLCSARAKRTGKPCGQLAMPNGKCKMHGGPSSGPGNVLFPNAGDKSGKRKLRNKLAALARRTRAKEVKAAESEGAGTDYSVEPDPALRKELNNAADALDRNQLAKAIKDYRDGIIRFWQFMEIRRAVARRGSGNPLL